MANPPRPLVAGNWKMNGLAGALPELEKIIAGAGGSRADLMICPPFTLLRLFADASRNSPVAIGAQDCHAEPSGAFTGDISAEMLADCGARAVMADLVIAYEPVWAIGTGLTPTPKDVGEVHGFIRERLQQKDSQAGPALRILYGGSVKPGNAAELMAVANVNGALVGGASLKAADFLGIAAAYR